MPKFQLFKIDQLFSKDAKKLFKSALKKQRELPRDFIPKISNYCRIKKIKFSCTPFDLSAVEYLKNMLIFINCVVRNGLARLVNLVLKLENQSYFLQECLI